MQTEPPVAAKAPDQREVLVHDAGAALEALRCIVHALRTQGTHAEQEFGVTAAQLFVLRQIGRRPGLSLHDLAQRTHTRDSSVSEVVSRLVSGGYVERNPDPGDRRRVRLTLAPAGRRVVAIAPRTVQERLVSAFEILPANVRLSLSSGLDQWVHSAGLDTSPSAMFFETPDASPSDAG